MTEKRRFALLVAWSVVAIGLALHLYHHAVVDHLVWALKQGDGDCVINWLGARAFEANVDPYTPAGARAFHIPSMGHPPTAVLWFLPFTAYGIYDLSQAVGHILIVMLLVHCLLVAEALRVPAPIPSALLVFALASSTPWWPYHVHMIQLSEPIALLYVLTWIFLRRRHDELAGVMLALSLTLKLYGGVVFLLLLVGKRWRAAITTVAVYLAVAIVPTVRWGPKVWLEFLRLMPGVQEQWSGLRRNASLNGIVIRCFTPACVGKGVPTVLTSSITITLSLLLVGLILWRWRLPAMRRDPGDVDPSIDVPFALCVTASAWLNPYTWPHYDVTLLMPMAVALVVAWRRPEAWITKALVTLLLAGIAYLLTVDGNEPHPATHLLLHWYEVANWAPWPLTLVALAIAGWPCLRPDGEAVSQKAARQDA